MYDQKKFSLRRVENEKICSHPEKRYVAKYFVSEWSWSGNQMDRRRGKVVSSAWNRWFKERDKMRVLNGVRHRGKCVRRKNCYCIWHENGETTC